MLEEPRPALAPELSIGPAAGEQTASVGAADLARVTRIPLIFHPFFVAVNQASISIKIRLSRFCFRSSGVGF